MNKTSERVITSELKWMGTIIALMCVILTSLNILYPINIICGFIAAVLWAIVGMHWQENAIMIINVVMAVIYGMGILKWLL